jgi:trimeric autotransporter adhesin
MHGSNQSVEEAAFELGVTVSPVRTHIKHLRQKIGDAFFAPCGCKSSSVAAAAGCHLMSFFQSYCANTFFKERIMKLQLKRLSLAFAHAAFIGLAGCGGGGGTTAVVPVPVPVPPVVSTTTNVTTTVIDGALQNALVCVDKNWNGVCDAGETQGRTDAAGKVTLVVPNADVGLYPVVAVVGTDAVDADLHPIPTGYTLTSPAGNAAVVSPLTAMVHETMQSAGLTAAAAEQLLQAQTGVTVSLFADFTTPAAKAAAATSTSPNAATLARMVVVTTHEQNKAVAAAGALGTAPVGSATPITQADLNKVVAQKILEMLPSILAIVTDPANTTPAAVEAALKTALAPAGSLAGDLLTLAPVQIAVGVNKAPVVADTPTAGFNLAMLNYTDASNWASRSFTGSLVQATPNPDKTRFVDRRARKNTGVLATWNLGGTPQTQANLHWTGSAWENCALNFESTSSLPDANGVRTTNYCNNYATSSNTRLNVDVSNRPMIDVYNEITAANYTDIFFADAATALGTATFPDGSTMRYQTTTDLTKAFGYSPGTGSFVFNYSAALATGGDSRTQPANTGCNLPEFQVGPTIPTTTLDGLVTAFGGQPCLFGQGSLVSGPTTFYEGGTQSATFTSKVFSNNTISIGTIGTVALNSAPTAFYTGNKLIRLGFQGTGTNAVTYYSCDQRYGNGSVRNCSVIGTGAYSITSLSDGSRVMEFSNPPTTPFTFNRAFVERNGRVYYGYKDKLTVTKSVRFTTTAANALFTQLAMPTIDPDLPMALTATSYQGTWDATDPSSTTVGNGTVVVFNATGTYSCTDKPTNTPFSCTLVVTPVAGGNSVTADIVLTNLGSGSVSTGTLNFLTGTGSGTYTLPAPGNFVVTRR